MNDVIERLGIATEQLRQVRKALPNGGQGFRLEVALQAIRSAMDLLKSSTRPLDGTKDNSSAHHGLFPIKVIWERRNKNQKFEAHIQSDGRIRLMSGYGRFSPSGACKEVVGDGSFNGWREWKYWDEGTQDWLPISELRDAGYFN